MFIRSIRNCSGFFSVKIKIGRCFITQNDFFLIHFNMINILNFILNHTISPRLENSFNKIHTFDSKKFDQNLIEIKNSHGTLE